MQQASQGKGLAELIEEVDAKLAYGGARRVSEFEAELLDQIDENFDTQIKMQRDLYYAEKGKAKVEEDLKKTEDAIGEYCSETTKNKILQARGWQFMPEEAEKIKRALSDKQLLEQISNGVEQIQRKYK